MNKEEKLFPLERILTASAADYCRSSGSDLNDYYLVGVTVMRVTSNNEQCPDLLKEFAKKVPPEAVRVTDYIPAVSANNYQIIQYASGTALVKNKPK